MTEQKRRFTTLPCAISGNSYLLIKILFFIALFFVLHNRWVIPRISYDQMRQMVAVENILSGNGVSFQFADANTENIHRDNSFPMGYYILMVPIAYFLKDVLLTHRILELVGLLLVVYQILKLAHWIGKKYGIPHFAWIAGLFTIIQLNPWRGSGFTDIWSLLFFMWALRMVVVNSSLSIKQLLGIGLLCYATISLRYAYYVLAFIPPLIVLFRWSTKKTSNYYPLLVLSILIAGTILFNKLYFSGMDHLESHFDSSRWFPDNIRQMDPTAFNAFFSGQLVFEALGLNRWGRITDWWLKYALLFFSFTMMILLAVGTLKTFKWQFVKRFQIDPLPLALWATVLVTIGFISGLSVYFPSQREEFIYTWQLITRYYAPAYVSLQLLLILLSVKDADRIRRHLFQGLVLFSFMFQIGYFTYFNSRYSWKETWHNYAQFYHRPDMPNVMDNYSVLMHDMDAPIRLPDEHLEYRYLSFYYLTGPERLVNYLRAHCPECLETFAGE